MNPVESREIELRLVRTFLEGEQPCKDYLLNVPDDSLEYYGLVWKELREYVMKGIECPSFVELHLSPLLPDNIRFDLKSVALMPDHYPVFKSLQDLKLVIDPLQNKYQRQLFIADGLDHYKAIQDMDAHEPFLPRAQKFLEESTKLLANWAKPRVRFGFGVGFNLHEVLQALQSENARIIPSGMDAFDRRSGGGYATGESVFMAAPSSQGKSLVAAQEGLNMALQGFKVKIVTLEMKASANMHRFLANAGQINVTRFRDKTKWSDQDVVAQERAGALLQEKIHAEGGYLEVIQPEGGYTLADAAIDLVVGEPDVLIIDYINLMTSDHSDLWKMIFENARGFKLLAVQHDALVISLAQLDDEGRVKYARSIKEHCDVLKVWKRDDDDEDDHEGQSFQWDVEVNVEKGRNSGTFKYWITINTAYMRAIDKESQINHLLKDVRKEMNSAAAVAQPLTSPRAPKMETTEPPKQFTPPQLPAPSTSGGPPVPPSVPTAPPPTQSAKPAPPEPVQPPPAPSPPETPPTAPASPSVPPPTAPPDFFGMGRL